MRAQGFPYYHLHSGNVLVFDDNNCRYYQGRIVFLSYFLLLFFFFSLSDMENSLIGTQPYLAQIMKPLIDKVDPDIVCFGCVLFEVLVFVFALYCF